MPKAKKLVPIYSILYKSSKDSLSHNYGGHGLGKDRCTPTFSKKKAIEKAKELEKEGKLVKVYQYGWKSRGFQSGEKQCEVVYVSEGF